MKTSHKFIVGGVLAFIVYNEFQKRNNSPKIFISDFITGKYNARTLPPFGIFIKSEQRENTILIAHEMVHWKQYQNEGLIDFVSNYSKYHHSVGYDKNPYEVEARLLSGEKIECLNNYTECVRNGTSLTVNNPNFRV